jgi:hypothetical protein
MLINQYCAAWDEPDAKCRGPVLETIWTEGATYTDPTAHTVGWQQLSNHIATVLGRYPNSKIVRTSYLDVHHDVIRFSWRKMLSDGKSLPEGIDIVDVSDGKIKRVVGFFGPLKARGT